MFKKNHIKSVRVADRSDDWFKLRLTGAKGHPGGIGGSDVGVILGLSKYKSRMQLFDEKIGLHKPQRFLNAPMMRGIIMEPHLYKIWKSFEDPTTWAEDYADDLQRRKSRKWKYPIYNEKYPHFLINLDAFIVPGEKKYGSEEVLEDYAPIEIKTGNRWARDKFIHGIDPSYYAQVQMQMFVTESPYGELFFESDGDIELFPIERDHQFQQFANAMCKEFWDRVLKGRELVKSLKGLEYQSDEYYSTLTEIDKLRPDPTESDTEEEYIKTSWKESQESKDADDLYKSHFEDYNFWNELEKICSSQKQLHKNNLQNFLKENHVSNGVVSYKELKTGEKKPKDAFKFQKQKRGDNEFVVFRTQGGDKFDDDMKEVAIEKSKQLKELLITK